MIRFSFIKYSGCHRCSRWKHFLRFANENCGKYIPEDNRHQGFLDIGIGAVCWTYGN